MISSYGVITAIEEGGAMANAGPDVYVEVEASGWNADLTEWSNGKYLPLWQATSLIPAELLVKIHVPVFHLGEILALGPTGREVLSPGRKPSKWFVTCEEFSTFEEAFTRAAQVQREAGLIS